MAPTSPQTPIKPVPHNGGGRGDQSSHGEPALHRSMCLFKQEASSLKQEGFFLFFGEAGVQLFPDQRSAGEKELPSGQERLLLVLDQYWLCLSSEVMESQKRLAVSWCWFIFKLRFLKLLKSVVLSCEYTGSSAKQAPIRRDPTPLIDPEALILNGTLVPSPQEIIN